MRGVLALACLLAACGDTTGGALVKFSASSKGAAGDGPLVFTTGGGASVTLTRARLHLGAVYLNQSVPTSGSAPESCISQGIYVAEVFGPLDVDLLKSADQPFPSGGEGTTTEARTAEVWLTGADVNAVSDSTVIFDVAGSAEQDGGTYPFTGQVTIGANRTPASTDPALPSASPVCRQRIVSPILVGLTPTPGGHLSLSIDPRHFFDGVDFTTLPSVSTAPPAYEIPDDSSGAGGALFRGLHSGSGVYQLTWSPGP